MGKRLEWTNEVLDELYLMKFQDGKSLMDLRSFIYSKYGVVYTQARISQVLKQYKESFNADCKIQGGNETI